MSSPDGTTQFKDAAITGALLDQVVMFHGSALPSSPTNKIPANGLFRLDTLDGNNAPGIYENTNTQASPIWTFRSAIVNLTTAQRTGLSSWPATIPIYDSDTHKFYYNSHASAPGSITWTEALAAPTFTTQSDTGTGGSTSSTTFVDCGFSITLPTRAGGYAIIHVDLVSTINNASGVGIYRLEDDGAEIDLQSHGGTERHHVHLTGIVPLDGSVITVGKKSSSGSYSLELRDSSWETPKMWTMEIGP